MRKQKNFPPEEIAELIEKLLDSFDSKRNKSIDEDWAKEAESRLDAYDAGKIDGTPISKVFEEIERKDFQ